MTSASSFDRGGFKLPGRGQFSLFRPGADLETREGIEGRTLHRKAVKRELRRALQREGLADVLPKLPAPGIPHSHDLTDAANGRHPAWRYLLYQLRCSADGVGVNNDRRSGWHVLLDY